jgi:hypothetical protein
VREELYTKDNIHVRPCSCGVVKSIVGGDVQIFFDVEGMGLVAKRDFSKLITRAERKLVRIGERVKFFTVQVVRARGLRNADHFLSASDVSDPYCIVELPGIPATRIRTGVIKDTLNPVWMHTERITNYKPGGSLQFTVMDQDLHRDQDDFLGRAVLTSQEFYPQGFSGEIFLTENQTGETKKRHGKHARKAFLQVVISPTFREPDRISQRGISSTSIESEQSPKRKRSSLSRLSLFSLRAPTPSSVDTATPPDPDDVSEFADKLHGRKAVTRSIFRR